MVAADRKGEMICRCRYSESEAGTDLANLRTRAVRDGQEWVINAARSGTAGAARHSRMVCVRTDPDSAAIAEFR